jgi:hypothetical protein
MNEIVVFVEGGGHSATLQAELRVGFDALFRSEKTKASEKRASLRFICCGGRQEAYDAFIDSLNRRQKKVSALLVDSETSIVPASAESAADAKIRVEHLRQKSGSDGRDQGDGWPLFNVEPERVHLMVQCMEAWIVADPEALASMYKQKFHAQKLPARRNLEDESKADVYKKLNEATEGQYTKIKDASKLLASIKPEKVASRCPRFRIFREWLSEVIDA